MDVSCWWLLRRAHVADVTRSLVPVERGGFTATIWGGGQVTMVFFSLDISSMDGQGKGSLSFLCWCWSMVVAMRKLVVCTLSRTCYRIIRFRVVLVDAGKRMGAR